MANDEPSPRGDENPESDQPGSGISAPIAFTTADPVIEAIVDHQADGKQRPDTTVSVETTQVSEPSPLYVAGVRTVVIEQPRRDSGRSSDKKRDRRRDEGDGDGGDEPDHRQDQPQSQQQQPSMMKNLLITAVVALVCGVIGAMGYSYFFGSKSDESSSKNQSGTRKESSSKKKSGGGSQEKESGKESNEQASTSSSIPGFSSAEDADTLKKQIMDLMQRVDRLGERVDRMTRPRDETPPVLHTLQIKIGELAREMDEVAALPARFRHLENRIETVQEDLKILRARVEAQQGGVSAGGPPGLTLPRGTGALAAPEGGNTSGEDPTMELGISLLERGQYASAREVFQRLQLAQPKDARVWYLSAMAEGLTSGNWDGTAKKLAEKGLERERAGTPPAARIDAALATRTPIRGEDWIASLRRRVLSAHDRGP
jgi:hypothetical protein